MTHSNSRRSTLQKLAGTLALTGVGSALTHRLEAAESRMGAPLKGKINHSVCRWCYQNIPLEDLCKAAKDIGLQSIELVGPSEWPTLTKYGLTAALPNGAGMGIEKGFNDPQYHDALVKSYQEVIPLVAKAGFTQIICFSGNRNGMDDQKGMENAAQGLKRLMSAAEQ
jgi:hydroxypyruvate isomerase